MAIFRVERDELAAIDNYKLARETGWHPGTLNEELVASGSLPFMEVSRRLVILNTFSIPLLPIRMEVPADVVATHPIPVRNRYTHNH